MAVWTVVPVERVHGSGIEVYGRRGSSFEVLLETNASVRLDVATGYTYCSCAVWASTTLWVRDIKVLQPMYIGEDLW